MKTILRITMTATAMALVMISPALAQQQSADPTNITPSNNPALTNGEKPLHHKPNFHEKLKRKSRRIERKVEQGKMTEEQGAAAQKEIAKVEEKRLQMIHENGEKPLDKKQRKMIHRDLKAVEKKLSSPTPTSTAQ